MDSQKTLTPTTMPEHSMEIADYMKPFVTKDGRSPYLNYDSPHFKLPEMAHGYSYTLGLIRKRIDRCSENRVHRLNFLKSLESHIIFNYR